MQSDALTYELTTIDGRPWARWSDGTLLPVVRGGADDDGTQGNNEGDAGTGDNGAGGQAGGQAGSGEGAGKVTFTPEQQAHIDALIEKNTGKTKTATEKAFKTWLDQQAMSDADRLKAESAAKDQLVEAANREVLKTKVETAAERYALAAKVKPDRVTKFMRLVDLDLDKLTDDGKPDNDAIKALIEKEAAASPEFLGAASNGGGGGSSGGEFNGANNGKVWTRAEISKLSDKDYEKYEPEILAQMQAGGIK